MRIDKYTLESMGSNIPCYCFDTVRFKENIERFRDIFGPDVRLLFSLKANPFFMRTALDYADGIEICSDGELYIARRQGADPAKITYGGICKERTDIVNALRFGIRRFSIESVRQLTELDEQAAAQGVKVNALLRLSTKRQFGMSVQDAGKCIRDLELSNTAVTGLHYYPKTMRMSGEDVGRDYAVFEEMLSQINAPCIKEISYGAGIGVNYFGESSHWKTAEEISGRMAALASQFDVTYEAGRLLAADAGVYIVRVVEVKEKEDGNFVIVNGGRHQFAYFGGIIKQGSKLPVMSVIGNSPGKGDVKTTIVGALCNEADILANDIAMPPVHEGDFIVFYNAGAYCVTEGIALFLSRDIPAVFLAGEGEIELRRARRSYEWLEDLYLEEDSMKNKYYRILEQETGRDRSRLGDEISFKRDLDMSSLEIAMLYPRIEDEFGIEFSPLDDDFGEIFDSVGSLWRYIEGKRNK